MFAVIGRRGFQDPPDVSVGGQLAQADAIDGSTGGIGRVLHRESQLYIHGHIAENPAFHANETYFLVIEPGHIVAGGDMDASVLEFFPHNSLNSGCFGRLFLMDPLSVQHIEKIRVAAGI